MEMGNVPIEGMEDLLHSKVVIVQARRNELENRLSQKDEEVSHLRAQLENGAALDSDAEESTEHRKKIEDAKLQDCRGSVTAHIQELVTFLKDHGLQEVNPTGDLNHSRNLHSMQSSKLSQILHQVKHGYFHC